MQSVQRRDPAEASIGLLTPTSIFLDTSHRVVRQPKDFSEMQLLLYSRFHTMILANSKSIALYKSLLHFSFQVLVYF